MRILLIFILSVIRTQEFFSSHAALKSLHERETEMLGTAKVFVDIKSKAYGYI